MSTSPPAHQLAQFNVARLRAPLDSPSIAEFVALLAPVNALAEAAPGFVWRLVDDLCDDATATRPYGDLVIVNLSVWQSPEALWEFTYRSGHLDVMRRRRDWFHRMVEPHLALWWVPAGHRPGIDEAVARLAQLRADGPGPDVFTFRDLFPAGPTASPAGPGASPAGPGARAGGPGAGPAVAAAPG